MKLNYNFTEEQKAVFYELYPDVSPRMDTMALVVGISRARVKRALDLFRDSGLAEWGPMINEDTGAPHGSGTWLTPLGGRVQDEMRKQDEKKASG